MPGFVDGVCAEYGYGGPSPQLAVATGAVLDPSWGLIRCNPAGAITGVIIAKSSRVSDQLWVVNESANTITFAAQGVSNVADGAGAAIAANTARLFVWDAGIGLWSRAA